MLGHGGLFTSHFLSMPKYLLRNASEGVTWVRLQSITDAYYMRVYQRNIADGMNTQNIHHLMITILCEYILIEHILWNMFSLSETKEIFRLYKITLVCKLLGITQQTTNSKMFVYKYICSMDSKTKSRHLLKYNFRCFSFDVGWNVDDQVGILHSMGPVHSEPIPQK